MNRLDNHNSKQLIVVNKTIFTPFTRNGAPHHKYKQVPLPSYVGSVTQSKTRTGHPNERKLSLAPVTKIKTQGVLCNNIPLTIGIGTNPHNHGLKRHFRNIILFFIKTNLYFPKSNVTLSPISMKGAHCPTSGKPLPLIHFMAW